MELPYVFTVEPISPFYTIDIIIVKIDSVLVMVNKIIELSGLLGGKGSACAAFSPTPKT
jgi:hypothetical protein